MPGLGVGVAVHGARMQRGFRPQVHKPPRVFIGQEPPVYADFGVGPSIFFFTTGMRCTPAWALAGLFGWFASSFPEYPTADEIGTKSSFHSPLSFPLDQSFLS